jgi:hypothetical protein
VVVVVGARVVVVVGAGVVAGGVAIVVDGTDFLAGADGGVLRVAVVVIGDFVVEV